jgi:hypothetical protein
MAPYWLEKQLIEIGRFLRKLKERGIFFAPPKMIGRFFISEKLLQKKDAVIK